MTLDIQNQIQNTSVAVRRWILFGSAVLIGSFLVGYLANLNQTLPALIIAGMYLLAVLILWPESITLIVIFLIYINAAAVVINFHNVPTIVGQMVMGLLIIPFGIYFLFRREKIIINPVLIAMTVYLSIQAAGGVFAIRPDIAGGKIQDFLIEGIALYFLILNLVRTPTMLRLAIWAVVLASLAMGALSLYQETTQTYSNNYWGFAQVGTGFGTGEENLQGEIMKPRLVGPIGEDNRYAQIMVVAAPLALFLAMGERKIPLKILGLIGAFFIVAGALLTYSRGGMGALAAIIGFMVLFRFVKVRTLAIVLACLLLIPIAVPNFTGRLVKLQNVTLEGILTNDPETGIMQADSSVRSRATEMISSWLMFADYPLIGVGPGNYATHYHDYAYDVGIEVKLANRQAHTLYGGIAAETGFLGIVSFFMIVFLSLRDLFRARQGWLKVNPTQAAIAGGLILGIIAYLVSGIFLHFAYIRYFWLIMGIAGAAGAIYQTEVLSRKEAAIAVSGATPTSLPSETKTR